MSGTMNKVILIGNLGDEIKMHQFDDNNSIGRFPIATSENFTSKDTGEKVTQTEWHNIIVRNKLAEICEKYLKKGDKVYVEGKIKTRKWQDQNGQDRYTTEVVANDVIFLTPKNSDSESHSSYSNPGNDSQKPESGTATGSAMTDDEDPDDLPF